MKSKKKSRYIKLEGKAYERNASPSFAHGLNFYKLFWVFFIGCFIGVVLETIWCAVTLYKIENRSGLVFGPFNPVYGSGAVFITLCLYKLRNLRDLWIFVDGVVLGGAFEYLCSWLQQLVFGTVSWEYSQTQFNIGGRTTLLYAFIWGILALLWVKNLFPLMSHLIEKIPNKIGKTLTWVLIVFMVVNMGTSALAVTRQTERRRGIPANNVVEKVLDRYFNDHFLKWVYPNMMVAPENKK